MDMQSTISSHGPNPLFCEGPREQPPNARRRNPGKTTVAERGWVACKEVGSDRLQCPLF
jgi:hypothetical protein